MQRAVSEALQWRGMKKRRWPWRAAQCCSAQARPDCLRKVGNGLERKGGRKKKDEKLRPLALETNCT